MLSDWTRIELATRLHRVNDILDRILPDDKSRDVEKQLNVVLEHIARNETVQGTAVLEDLVNANPSWLRGYLLLATVYEDRQATGKAINALESGLNGCKSGLRLLANQGWRALDKRISGRVIQDRVRRRTERFTQYEKMFRHRLAVIQIRRGHFDEAIECWAALENVPCA